MATYSVPQSGGAISISSNAAGFTQNSNPYQYYLNRGGINTNPTSAKFTFTFADGGSFYLTNFNEGGYPSVEDYPVLGGGSNLAGIPSTPDDSYGSTINVIGGLGYGATYDIWDATSNIKLVDDFQPSTGSAGSYFNPIVNFEYSSGLLTISTPSNSSGTGGIGAPKASIGSAGTVSYTSDVTGYRGGAGSATPLTFNLTGYVPASSSVPCFYQGTLITLASGQTKSVEDLAIGDIIHTHKGPLPLKWLACRKVTKPVRQQFPHQLPVVIKSGALGVNMPSTDLMVSEGHTILVDGHLICAALLENEINCYRARCEDLPDEYYYFHLEFQDEEVLVLSNGAPTASYVNTQTRMMFDNYQEYVDLYGDLNAEIKPLEYKHRRTVCFLDPYKAVVRRSFQEPAIWV